MRSYTIWSEIERAGIEIEIEVQVNVLSWGSGDSYFEPGDPPEWEVETIRTRYARLVLDHDRDLTDEEQDIINDKIGDEIGEWLNDAIEEAAEWQAERRYS